MKRLCTIEVSQRNRIVRAGAGLFWQELEDNLTMQGWTSGHFPQSIQSATVGGMVSTRGVGTFSGRYGKIDDMVRALEVVLPSGEIIRTPRYGEGLFPPPKRSCGPELRELFLGAEGALGIVTEALLTIWRRAETRLWDTFTFPSTPVALAALEEIHAGDFVPGLVRLYDEDEAAPRLASLGYEPGQALLLLGYEGDPEMCDLACRRVALVCRAHAGEQRGPEGAEQWYRHRLNTRAVVDALSRDGGVGDAIEIAAPWDCLSQVWTKMRAALLPLCDNVHCHFSHFYRTGGSVYVIFVAATQAADPVSGMHHYNRCLRAALDACLAAGGSISHHHGVGRSKAQWMAREHGTSMSVLRGIKDLLDPQHLMNPGVLGL
jgi:alkyldihydroxyacetonephosphate synthase